MCVENWSYAKNWRQSRVDSAKLAREKKKDELAYFIVTSPPLKKLDRL
jgi:hypothetical protein